MNIRRAKLALVGLILFLVGLVVLADSGRGAWLFQLANTIPYGDKVGHLVLFGTLSYLLNLVYGGVDRRVFAWRMLKGSALLLPVVTLEECSQVFFRSRTFDLIDLAADCAGIWLCGGLAVACLNWKYSGMRPAAMSRVQRLRGICASVVSTAQSARNKNTTE